MKYELAKELKDAGFPQAGDGKWIVPPDQLVARKADRIYVPTLSELIKACGDDFRSLERGQDEERKSYWLACKWDSVSWDGTTPEEAVARLWLALCSSTNL